MHLYSVERLDIIELEQHRVLKIATNILVINNILLYLLLFSILIKVIGRLILPQISNYLVLLCLSDG